MTSEEVAQLQECLSALGVLAEEIEALIRERCKSLAEAVGVLEIVKHELIAGEK